MKISNIVMSYDGVTNQLNGVTTALEKGKITTIIGPNGCGKSTLLGVISRNHTPSRGNVRLENKDILDFKAKEFAQKLAIVYQTNITPHQLTVEKLVSYGRVPYQNLISRNVEEDKAAVDWAIECTNLQDIRDRHLENLSGGQRQRVWIAMALAQKSEILCLDEPTTYLDIYYQIELLEIVKKLNEEHGLTIVMVLHDMNQAIKYSDHIILMKDGQVLTEGPPEIVMTKEIIKEVYGVDVLVENHELTGMYMVPINI